MRQGGHVANPSVPTPGRPKRRRPAPGEVDARTWRRAAFALFAVAAGTNVPTPLLLIYRDTLDLTPDVLTAVFGVYAIGLIPALFLAGPLSDRLGRRRVVLPLVVLSGLTSLLLIQANSSVLVLFVGRCLQGAVSGAAFGVGSAWVGELSIDNPAAAGRRAAVAMTAGFSLSPLIAGVLAQYVAAPTTLPYLIHVAVVVAGFLAARNVPETVVPVPESTAPRGPLLQHGDGRTVLTVLLPLAVCVYAFPSVIIAAVPLLIETSAPPVLLTGILAGLTLGAGALAAPLQRRMDRSTAPVAAGLGAVGYLLAGFGSGSGSPPLLLVAALLLGAGGGLALSSGLGLTARLAQPGRRGALSAFFLGSAYLGFALPYVTAVVSKTTAVQVPLTVFSALAALLCVRLALVTRRGLAW